MNRFENKVALVVAATRGIGLACATILAKGGARVYLGVRRMDAGQQIADEIIANGGYAAPVYFNAYEEDAYEPMIQQIIDQEGKIDILVNNYGGTDVNKDKDVVNGDFEAWNTIMRSNLNSVYLPVKYAVPHMPKGGSIINIGSIGGFTPDLDRVAYCVSKAAVMSLTENIATQYARQGIRCNAVLPGLIATDAAIDNMPQEFIDSFLKHVPLQRFGQPEDIANAVAFLASDEASFITGLNMPVAGGYKIPTPMFGDIAPKMID